MILNPSRVVYWLHFAVFCFPAGKNKCKYESLSHNFSIPRRKKKWRAEAQSGIDRITKYICLTKLGYLWNGPLLLTVLNYGFARYIVLIVVMESEGQAVLTCPWVVLLREICWIDFPAQHENGYTFISSVICENFSRAWPRKRSERLRNPRD